MARGNDDYTKGIGGEEDDHEERVFSHTFFLWPF